MLNQHRFSLNKGVKASLAFFIASIITKGIAYITTPIYTRLLPADVFGETTVFLTWLQIFGIIAMFSLHAGVFNNGMVDYPENRDEYSFSMLILSNIISIVFSILLLILYPFVQSYIGLDYPLIILMCLVFLLQPAYSFWTAKQRYELKYKYSVIWSVVSAVLSPTVAIICILLFPEKQLYARLFGAEITLLVIYLIFYLYISFKAHWKLNTIYWKGALLFNLPLIPHYLSTYLLNSSDRIMISHLDSNVSTAYYAVAYSVASVVLIIWTSANGSLIPYTYEKCKEKNYEAISAVTNPLLFLFAGACVVIILLSPEIVSLMATKEYREAVFVIPPIVGGVFFQVHYYLYANVLYYFKKPKYVMLGSVIATVANLILNYFFILKFGYIAAGYTTLLCYFIQASIDYYAMRRIVGNSIYDMKTIAILSCLILIISLFSGYLYNFIVARYCLLAVMVLLVYVKRTVIKASLKVFITN